MVTFWAILPKISLGLKTAATSFWHNFRLIFIPTSGHTGKGRKRRGKLNSRKFGNCFRCKFCTPKFRKNFAFSKIWPEKNEIFANIIATVVVVVVDVVCHDDGINFNVLVRG